MIETHARRGRCRRRRRIAAHPAVQTRPGGALAAGNGRRAALALEPSRADAHPCPVRVSGAAAPVLAGR